MPHALPLYCIFSSLILLSFLFYRLKNQRKAAVTTVDKKIPNGILEEQGKVNFLSMLFKSQALKDILTGKTKRVKKQREMTLKV